MSDENVKHSTRLVHVKDAADNLKPVLEAYMRGDISYEEFYQKWEEVIPNMGDVGTTINDEQTQITVNTKPVPKNAGAVVYFYLDNDGVLQMTLRLPRFGDNTEFSDESEDRANLDEAAGIDLLRLIQSEHADIVKSVIMQHVLTGSVGGSDPHEVSEGDDPLEGINDESVKKQIRKFMNS